MSTRIRTAESLFKKIFTDQDPAGVYADFDAEITALAGEGVDPGKIAVISTQDERLRQAADRVRRQGLYRRGDFAGRRFRGSGAIVLGDAEGLHLYHYRTDNDGGDPVAERYPGYQWEGFRKAGRGALLAARGFGRNDFLAANRYLEEQVVERGIKPAYDPANSAATAPHHLGYAWAQRSGGGPLVAGATGMLAGDVTQGERDASHRAVIVRDEARGWVEWPLDRFAGYDDAVMAAHALGWAVHNRDTAAPYIPSLDELATSATDLVNLH